MNIAIFESDLSAEIDFNGKYVDDRAIFCDDLLGRLLSLDIEKERGRYKFVYPEDIKPKSTDSLALKYLNRNSILDNLFEVSKKIIEDESSGRTLENIKKYIYLCDTNNISMNYKSFELFLSVYNIKLKEYTPIYINEDNSSMLPVSQKAFTEQYLFVDKRNLTIDDYFVDTEKNINKMEKAFFYEDCLFSDVIYILIHHILKNGKYLKRCAECNRWFTPGKSDAKYCERIEFKPINNNESIIDAVTCREKALKNRRKEREENNDVLKLENRIASRLQRRTKAGTVEKSEMERRKYIYNRFKEERKIKKKQFLSNVITKSEYLKWLNEYDED